MDADLYAKFLVANLPKAKLVSGGTEVLCRCMYCGDSKNPNKGHFYISIPRNDQELSFFDCKKCPAHGIVTHKKLTEWGIYDPTVAIDLISHNTKAFNNPSNKRYNTIVYNVTNNYISDDKLSLYKLKYINERLGTSLTYEDCLSNKIILNLMDLIESNHITELTRYPNIVDRLDSGFVGFLSIDNTTVNMRNLEISKDIPDNINKRYVNYNLFKTEDTTYRFYTIPCNVDITKPISIHLAEGPFDILSIKFNLHKGGLYNAIYSSINGNGYLGIIKYFIISWQLPWLELHYYVDNDFEQYKINSIAQLLKPFGFPFYIHRNKYPNEKDFGVPLNRISEIVTHVM